MCIRAGAYIAQPNLHNHREMEATRPLFGKSLHLCTQQAKYSRNKDLAFFFLFFFFPFSFSFSFFFFFFKETVFYQMRWDNLKRGTIHLGALQGRGS